MTEGDKKKPNASAKEVAVIGAGSWGTALSQLLALNGHRIRLWARNAEVVHIVNAEHYNPRYLSDQPLSESIVATLSYAEAIDGADAVVIVTPSSILRSVAQTLSALVDAATPIIVCSKGVEEGSGLLPLEVFESELGGVERLAVLSGPNHAEEVIKGIHSATVIASSSEATACFFQELFATDFFRTYISDDTCGVELCAAFKNVIAIAVGLSYGLKFGDNTAALLITRGLAEMGRLVKACGGNTITCMGLAGTGDLIATCMSEHSRNRRFGETLAQGATLNDFSVETHMVVEGAYACKTLKTLADLYHVELPITDVVRGVVWEGVDLETSIEALTSRSLKAEFWGL